jgi:hypothetical protein
MHFIRPDRHFIPLPAAGRGRRRYTCLQLAPGAIDRETA